MFDCAVVFLDRWGPRPPVRRPVVRDASAGYTCPVMQPLKAHVRNGRLVLDDPATDLPEGSEVELVLVDGDMIDDERAALHDSLMESVEQMKSGQLIEADVALADLRSHR